MQQRQQLRQSIVQYIYSVSQSGTELLDTPTSTALWTIVLEPLESDIQRSEAKVIEHLARDYQAKLEMMITRAKQCLEKLQDDPLTFAVREAIQDLLSKESDFHQALVQLRKARVEDPDNTKGELQIANTNVKAINATLLHLRDSLISKLADYPAHKNLWTPLIASCNKLQLVNQRLDGLSHPENNASYPEFKHIIEAKSQLVTLKEESRLLSETILANKEELDTLINENLTNYTPNRVHPIDRAILRLGAYELQYKKDIPVPVIMAEAIRLAEYFSTSEAARFINGVLTGISKKSRA